MKTVQLLILICVLYSCSKNEGTPSTDMVETDTISLPMSTVDYNSLDNWSFHPDKNTILTNYNLDIEVIDENLAVSELITVPNNASSNTGVDVFFVHPTLLTTEQSLSEPTIIPIQEQNESLINLTILAQGGLLSKYGRMFAPRYRQSSSATYGINTDKEVQANIVTTSYSDVKAAFLHYLNNYNNGNKVILAGHSQGSYLLAFLLRDVFDTNEDLRSKLVTAALGGMFYVYANAGEYQGGWWQNIPLCTTQDQCGCIHNWTSFDETQPIPNVFSGFPEFNPILINSGLVYRAFKEDTDWFVQDSAFYQEQPRLLQNYITPNAGYGFGTGANFIAFDGLYTARFKRTDNQRAALSLSFDPMMNDQRPNDLAGQQNLISYPSLGYHNKDYQIYIWALMQQLDQKLNNCN